MRPLVLLLAVFACVPTTPAQSLQGCTNNLGVFRDPAPDLSAPTADAITYDGPTGLVDLHVVLINPYNEHRERPITTVGGMEFRVAYDDAGLVVTPSFPGFTLCELWSWPDVYCGIELPVAAGQCLLLNLAVGVFDTTPRTFSIVPVSSGASIPGEIAISDAGDDWSLSRATPASHAYGIPVFALYGPAPYDVGAAAAGWNDCAAVPAGEASWGSVKAIYR